MRQRDPTMRFSRTINAFVLGFTLLITLAVPVSYFLAGYQYQRGNIRSQLDTKGYLVQQIISNNPDYWAFENVRLESAILKTLDGGVIWTAQPSGVSVFLSSVYFTDEQTGWAAGGGGTIVKTTDGGNTWAPQNSGTTQFIEDVFFIDNQNGWAVGGLSTLLHTADGVRSLISVDSVPIRTKRSPLFLSPLQ